MFEPVKRHHLEIIKTLTLAIAGVSNLSPAACRTISLSLIKKTDIRLSETTIKRLYGFAESKFKPSLFTLNALAIYCGYNSWEAFKNLQPDEQLNIREAVDIFTDPLTLVLMQAGMPTIIIKANAPDFTILSCNDAFQQMTYSKEKELKGLTLWEAFDPDKAGSSGPTSLLEAFHKAIYEGKNIHMEPLQYNITSEMPHIIELCWWDISIIPVLYDHFVRYLVIQATNITDKILHQDAIDQAIFNELTMAEDLAVTNVKLNVAVEKLTKSHNEISVAKKLLQATNHTLEQHIFERTKHLFESEARQRQLIDNAPVAIGVLNGPDYVIETANKKMIDVWGKGNTVINQPLAIALPEIKGQLIIALLDEVYKSGKPYINPELRGLLNIHGILQVRYFDLVYQPVLLSSGVIETIFVVAVDITEHVIARKRLERSESMLGLAVEASNIGLWSFDTAKQYLEYNITLANILGWVGESIMTYQQALESATYEFRENIKSSIRNTVIDTGTYKFTYSHKRFNDNKIIWLKGIGKVTTSDTGEGKVYSGIICEINEIDESNLQIN
jgi:two-component system sensor histidine kinase VicK